MVRTPRSNCRWTSPRGLHTGPTAQVALAFTDRHQDYTAAFTATGTELVASTAYDPLGNPTAQTGTMPGELGYQSEWTDPATGGVDMWHRRYDPVSSGFTAPDPIVRDPIATDPDAGSVAANRYAYADADPLGNQDPTGQAACADSACRVTYTPSTSSQEVEKKLKAIQPTPQDQEKLAAARAAARLSSAIEKLLTDSKIDQATAAELRPIVFGNSREAARLDKALGEGWRLVSRMAWDCVKSYRGYDCQGRHSIDVFRKFRQGRVCEDVRSARCLLGIVLVGAEALLTYISFKGIKFFGVGAEAAEARAGTLVKVKIGWKALTPSQAAGASRALSERLIAIRVKFQHLGRPVGVRVSGITPRVAKNCLTPNNSFTGDTLVLMADGTAKPIRDVEVGDSVMAADPETGETGPRKVIDFIRHGGLHTMVAVHLADGSTIDATDRHPFWVESRRAWVDAIDLEPGDTLVAAAADRLTVERLGISEQDLTAFNLTIAGLHTYYVVPAGAAVGPGASVLVHNAGSEGNPCPDPLTKLPRDGGGNVIGGTGPGKGKALSKVEREAVDNYEAGRAFDETALKSARQKIKAQEKYQGTRNKQKRGK